MKKLVALMMAGVMFFSNAGTALGGNYIVNAAEATEFTSDKNVIAADIREAMVQRKETVTVYYTQAGNLRNDFLDELIELALAETANPEEGDYLRWHYKRASAKLRGVYEGDAINYTITITLEYYTTAEQEAIVGDAIEKTLKKIGVSKILSDYENLKKIYDYIANHVEYDYKNLNNDSYTLKYSAYAALINKTAVCQGYSNLMYRMLRTAGIDTRIVTGFSRNQNHAWNIVKLDDKYYHLDVTWDSKRTNYDYFLRGSDNFKEHVCSEEYTTSQFQQLYPISKTDYVLPENDIVASGTCGENATWSLDSKGCLTISGTGALSDSSGYERYKDDIENLVIEEGITSITTRAFYNCKDLDGKLIIPKSVKTIGNAAFERTDLDEITILNPMCEIIDKSSDKSQTIDEDTTIIGYADSSAEAYAKKYGHNFRFKDAPFVDVNEGDWFYDSVYYNYFAGMMTGKSETVFAPNESLARAQFASILYRINGEPTVKYRAEFPDIEKDIWYTSPVLWAKDAGIVNGYGNGNFGPGDKITREQMAIMMFNYANSLGYDTTMQANIDKFADATSVSWYAENAVQWAVGAGIISGKSNGTILDPQGETARAQCAIIIQNFMEKYAE